MSATGRRAKAGACRLSAERDGPGTVGGNRDAVALLAAQLQPARPVPLGAAGSRWLVGPFGRRLDREAAASVLPCQAEGPLDDERLVAVAAERPWRFRRRQDFAGRAGCRACPPTPTRRLQQRRKKTRRGG